MAVCRTHFSKAQGYEIGKSLLEEDKIELAKSFIQKAKEKGVNLYLPVDVVIADDFSKDANTKVVRMDAIPEDWKVLILDQKRLNCMRK